MRRSDVAGIAITSVAGFLASLTPSLAGSIIGTPGPVAGVGLPALAILGGATWLTRRIRSRKQSH
jgi:hypothetical protein